MMMIDDINEKNILTSNTKLLLSILKMSYYNIFQLIRLF